jgi:hypothetical protein
MTRAPRTLLIAAGLLVPAVPAALAIDRADYSIEVLVDGQPLEEYATRGTTYVEAARGREYAIRLTNRSGETIAVALTVDGLNSIDAKTTTASGASKWVLGPYESTVLTGWQTGDRTARRFFFTSEQDSYGAYLGRTKNLGLIAAAVFRESPRSFALGQESPRPWSPAPAQRAPEDTSNRRDEARAESAPGKDKGASAGRGFEAAPAPQVDDFAATGIGRQVDHAVRRVDLDLEKTPVTVMELRYEYHAALVRLGVLPRGDDPARGLARRERARGFEGSYCPDPFR